ncbi:MFS transporter [Ancylobacter defluvii]|nr:MFS transporter [Ancylobacter defluvii]
MQLSYHQGKGQGAAEAIAPAGFRGPARSGRACLERSAMPPVIYIFSLCTFAVGFTEFITIGLVSAMADDLQVDVTRIELTVTTYAAGVVIGAPVLTALAARWSRKRLIFAAMLVFTAGNVIAGLSGSLTPLLFARLLSGLAHGVFFAVASSVATRLVAPERAGAALALVFGGVTVAMSLGVPVGTWLGTILHWQVIFLVIAACDLIGSLGIEVLMPAGSGEAATKGAGLRDLGVFFDRRLLAGASSPMLSYTGSFALYTFVSPFLLQVTNVSVGTASLTLLAYGLGAAVGNVMGGRLTDRQGMDRASIILLTGILLSFVLIAFALNQPAAMIGLVALLGLTIYGAIPPLQSRILMLAERHQPQAMDVASGMNIAAFNAGVVVGSGIGGAAISAWGLPSLAPVGPAIAVVAFIALLWQIVLPSMNASRRDATPATAHEGH